MTPYLVILETIELHLVMGLTFWYLIASGTGHIVDYEEGDAINRY